MIPCLVILLILLVLALLILWLVLDYHFIRMKKLLEDKETIIRRSISKIEIIISGETK